MSESSSHTGYRILRVLGALALIGILFAAARILIRVFNEDSGTPDEESHGV